MNISIFGLGYVGCVTLGCFAELGHRVIGVDIQQDKVDLINDGQPTVVEKDIDEIIASQHKRGLIEATTDPQYAVKNSDVSLICVGTPSTGDGKLQMDGIYDVTRHIGEALIWEDGFHTIAIRSTVPPGTNKKITAIIADESKKESGRDFAVISNPEFLREGSSVDDFFSPPMILIGGDSTKGIKRMKKLYSEIEAPMHVADIGVVEIMKFLNNSFHALKVTFANEVGRICRSLDIDSREAMRLLCTDTNLNISPAYLKPGFAFGGSCLSKDLKALHTLAEKNAVNVPVIGAIEESNEKQKQLALRIIENQDGGQIGFLGLSFKPGTDDLRNSAAVDLAEELLLKGYDLKVFDSDVDLSALTGDNESYIKDRIPQIEELMCPDMDEVVEKSDVIVVTQAEDRFADVAKRSKGSPVIDLVDVVDPVPETPVHCLVG